MNDTHSRRPPRTRAPATARPEHGAEPVLSSIPTQPGPPNDRQAANEEPLEPGEADPGQGRITQVASARKRWILAGGAVAAGIPPSQGLAWAIAGRPDAVPLLAVAALFALATGIPYAVAAMYEARQKLGARRSSITARIRSRMRWPNPSALRTPGPGTCPELMRSRKQNGDAPAPARSRLTCHRQSPPR